MVFAAERMLLVSLHDVAPVHLERLMRAEQLMRRAGVHSVQYLFVPEFHGRYRASEYPEFVEWCRQDRPFQVSWWLHGYYHQERHPEEASAPLALTDRLRRRFLTAGEGEFLSLDPAWQRRRLEAGLEEFSHCLGGIKPAGFVAPAWLYRPELLPLLREFGLPYTEDHHRLYDVAKGNSLPAPVITWATRTWWHKYGSLAVCPWRAWWFRDAPLLRVALHPHDFDHAETIYSIEQLLDKLRRQRQFKLPHELNWDFLLARVFPQP
jgi:predicted deacetylase